MKITDKNITVMLGSWSSGITEGYGAHMQTQGPDRRGKLPLKQNQPLSLVLCLPWATMREGTLFPTPNKQFVTSSPKCLGVWPNAYSPDDTKNWRAPASPLGTPGTSSLSPRIAFPNSHHGVSKPTLCPSVLLTSR